MRTIVRREEEIRILVKMELGHHYKDSTLLELLEEQEQKAQERKVFKRGKKREKEKNTSEIIKQVKE